MEIPAQNVKRSAKLYQNVFGWKLNGDPENPGFEDGTGHVIGHWKIDLTVAGESGVLPYIFVENVVQILERVKANGGDVKKSPYPEGNLRVATFSDPAGNVIGVWQK